MPIPTECKSYNAGRLPCDDGAVRVNLIVLATESANEVEPIEVALAGSLSLNVHPTPVAVLLS